MQAIKRPEVPRDLVGAVSFLTSDDAALHDRTNSYYRWRTSPRLM
jgi:hypothetical protein